MRTMKNLMFALIFLFPLILFSQERLEKAKESLSSKNSTTSREETKSNRSSRSGRINRNRDNDGLFIAIVEDVGFYLFYGAIIGDSEYRTLTPYPYFNNSTGEYLKIDTIQSKSSLFKISVNQLFNRGVNGIEFNANYRVLPILGIEASHLNFSENSIQGKEYLDITSFLLKYYRIREQNVSVWWGMGASYVANEVQTWGFSYAIGTEIFPVKPISLETSYKQSFINYNNVNEFKIHLKYHIKKTALYTGYHANKLGSEKANGIVFGAEYTF